MIFFTNFLALVIKAEVADKNSAGSAIYSAVLIIVNVMFFLSIWWNSWATMKATFSRRGFQVRYCGCLLVAMSEGVSDADSASGVGKPFLMNIDFPWRMVTCVMQMGSVLYSRNDMHTMFIVGLELRCSRIPFFSRIRTSCRSRLHFTSGDVGDGLRKVC